MGTKKDVAKKQMRIEEIVACQEIEVSVQLVRTSALAKAMNKLAKLVRLQYQYLETQTVYGLCAWCFELYHNKEIVRRPKKE